MVDYAVDMHQKLFEKQKAEELAAKAIAIKEEAIRDKWVVPNQRDLRPELSEKLTRLYYDDQHPSTRMMPDPLF